MQLAVQIILAGWHDVLGWALIVAGIALAGQALGFIRPRPGVAHVLRTYRPVDWSRQQSAHERTRPMDPDSQWQRVVAVAERGFAQIELIADLHADAAQELEAADDALARLLAVFKPDEMLSIRQYPVDPAPTPIIQPLAA
jgi:hypothetical protein